MIKPTRRDSGRKVILQETKAEGVYLGPATSPQGGPSKIIALVRYRGGVEFAPLAGLDWK